MIVPDRTNTQSVTDTNGQTVNKDLKKIFKALKAEGYTIHPTKGNHYEVRLDGVRVSTFGGTASDHHAIRNSLGPLKRLGFVWPPRR